MYSFTTIITTIIIDIIFLVIKHTGVTNLFRKPSAFVTCNENEEFLNNNNNKPLVKEVTDTDHSNIKHIQTFATSRQFQDVNTIVPPIWFNKYGIIVEIRVTPNRNPSHKNRVDYYVYQTKKKM